ncbi:putative GNAT family acetyltransferase [Jackrogersella minutella]|nr:putative GNAT family acetyltransferase [Jackrogersella minutella]
MSTTKPFDPFRSERVIHRAVKDVAWDTDFVHGIQSDAEAQSGSSYGLLRPETMKTTKEFQQYVAEECLLGVIICLADPSNRSLIGKQVGIICLKSNPPRLAHHRWSEISIDIAREYRGKGYGGEAILWSLWYGFQMAGLHRVQIQSFSFNEGAMRLYDRLGFKEEGRQRDSMWFNGGWHDNVLYGMLEDE